MNLFSYFLCTRKMVPVLEVDLNSCYSYCLDVLVKDVVQLCIDKLHHTEVLKNLVP